jgi:serine/threonine protein kinase
LADSETYEVIELMLQICPNKRPNCSELLRHKYFADLPSDYKLDIGSITGTSIKQRISEAVDVDDMHLDLGKRERVLVGIIDLEEGGKKKKQKLVE